MYESNFVLSESIVLGHSEKNAIFIEINSLLKTYHLYRVYRHIVYTLHAEFSTGTFKIIRDLEVESVVGLISVASDFYE